jgi:squalene synthase HpnC
MEKTIPPSLKPAFEKCRKMAASHYENFPVASLLLPKESRLPVAALYAFARTADDFADEPPPYLENKRKGATPPGASAKGDEKKITAWRLKKLALWEAGLRSALAGKTAPPELRAFAFTVKNFKIPSALPLALLKAFRLDADFHPFQDWEKAFSYCELSADPVGRMVLLISGIRDEKMHRYSDHLCTGLQLINFWQDSSRDLARGRIYYPLSELRKAGVSPEELLARKNSPATRLLVQRCLDRAEGHFRKGFPLLKGTSRRLRLELKATCLGGLGILHQIRRMDYNVLNQRPAWSAWDKLSLGFRALFGPASP